MPYPIELKENAIKLRTQGYSYKEIAGKLNIAKSTASHWLRDIRLSIQAQKRLQGRRIFGYYKTMKTKRKKKRLLLKKYSSWANEILKKIEIGKTLSQIFCALLYWAEGGKFTDNHLEFTNSDPKIIKIFLKLLKKGFEIDEKKLKANIHLHEYHIEKKQKKFWSKITGIPSSQFNKSYLKPHTKKRVRENYPGCVRICYYSADTARRIKALYSSLIKYI